jgi:hypothetical protein
MKLSKIFLIVLFSAVGILLACSFSSIMNGGLISARHNILVSPVIDDEGLILPSLQDKWYWNSDKVTIYFKGSRRLNPITIQHWKSLKGVIDVKEMDYSVEITRSHNFQWDEIFSPPAPKK